MGDAITFNRAFSFAPDQALVMRNCEYDRQIIYGGGWARIRLGLLCAFQRSTQLGANNALSNNLFFGIGAQGGPVGNYGTKNFVGVSLIGNPAPGSTQTLGYTAGSLGNDYYTATAGQIFKKYGNAIVNAGAMTAVGYFPITRNEALVASENRRAVFIVDITRPRGGSGTGAVSAYCVPVGQVSFDFRADHMMDAMDRTGTPTLLGTAMTVIASAVSVPIGEEFGALDTLMLFWNKTILPLEVYALGANVLFDNDYPAVLAPNSVSSVKPFQAGAFFSFEGYSPGTLTAGESQDVTGTALSSGSFPSNSGWNGTYSLAGSVGYRNTELHGYYGVGATGDVTALYGTAVPWPREQFTYYGTGTASSSVTSMNLGAGWDSYGTFYGTSNPPALALPPALFGTAAGWPYESFSYYNVGTIGTVVLSAGSAWVSYGTIYV